ncbi:MAG: 23S rRNA (uracil(1939)-C(5))-methyltransferase RlmD [Flavobacteriales bacterium]
MSRKFKKERFDDVAVVDITAKGKGVVKSESGKVIFVDGVVPGDHVNVETYKKRRGYFEANLLKIVKPSIDRVIPPCEHFGICGGCKWQNLDYEAQLRYKQKEILHNLTHLSGMELPEIEPIKSVASPYFYRNKMEYSFSNQRWLTSEEIDNKEESLEKKGLGFHKAGMWDKVVDIQKCHLQKEPANDIRNGIREYAIKNDLDFFNPRAQEGFLRTLMIRNSSIGEFMVLIQFFKEDETKRVALLDYLKENFEISSLLYCINSKANDTLYDQEIELFDGRDYIIEKMEDLEFKVNAKSFFQTNSDQAFELYKITREFADLNGDEVVYDLYTGTGTIAQFVAKKTKKVVGVESVPEAIEAAKENAHENKIDNAFFEVGDMKEVFNEDFINRHGKADVVITDPPRNGMHPDVVKQLIGLGAGKIVYVSCNNATQARDLSLMSHAYKMTRCRAVDMFPQTQHVENIVLLEKI